MPFWSKAEDNTQKESTYTSDDLSSFSAAGAGGGGDDPLMASATGLGERDIIRVYI